MYYFQMTSSKGSLINFNCLDEGAIIKIYSIWDQPKLQIILKKHQSYDLFNKIKLKSLYYNIKIMYIIPTKWEQVYMAEPGHPMP